MSIRVIRYVIEDGDEGMYHIEETAPYGVAERVILQLDDQNIALRSENKALREALEGVLEIAPKAWDSAMCHNGICTRAECSTCGPIDIATALLQKEQKP